MVISVRPTLIACDGGVVGQAPHTRAGTWAACAVGPDQTLLWSESGVVPAGAVPTLVVTSQQSEFYALIRLLEAVIGHWPYWGGRLVMDSAVTAGRAFSGYSLMNIPESWARRLVIARDRLDLERLHLHMVKGHPTPAQLALDQARAWGQQRYNEWNVWCDHACQAAARQWVADHADLAQGDSAHEILRARPAD